MPKKVLITGGTGLVGKQLVSILEKNNFQVALLSRGTSDTEHTRVFQWNPAKGEIDQNASEYAENIIHLAGAGIADKRWTKKRKDEILNSRAKTAELLSDWIHSLKFKPNVFISASAIGYYGAITSDKIFSEDDNPADDFLGKTCEFWEAEADRFALADIRTVILRLGLVLDNQGGAFAKMLKPFKMGFGAVLGSGKQYMPWVHLEDVGNIFLKALEDSEFIGTYNTVAPQHINNIEFTETLSRVLGKKIFLPAVPSFALKLLMGEMSKIVLEGSRVSGEKIISSGYKFKFTDLEQALNDLI